jgi:hypothetical protein
MKRGKPLPSDPRGYATLLEMLRYSFPACKIVAKEAGAQLRIWIAHSGAEVGAAVSLNAAKAHDEALAYDYATRWIDETARKRPELGCVALATA